MKRLEKFFPPGYQHIVSSIAWLAIVEAVVLIVGVTVYSLRLSRSLKPYNLRITGTASPFNYCVHGAFKAWWFYLLLCVAVAIVLRTYYTRRSNSLFIMKRLESSGEMTRRWLAFPLAAAVIGLALCVIVILILKLQYPGAVPPQYMPPAEPIDITGGFSFSSGSISVQGVTVQW